MNVQSMREQFDTPDSWWLEAEPYSLPEWMAEALGSLMAKRALQAAVDSLSSLGQVMTAAAQVLQQFSVAWEALDEH